jgi:hypothetical protein
MKREDQLLTLRGNVPLYDAARAFKLCYGCWPRWMISNSIGITTYGTAEAPMPVCYLPEFADDVPELTNS